MGDPAPVCCKPVKQHMPCVTSFVYLLIILYLQRCAVVDVTMDGVQVQKFVLVTVDGWAPDAQQVCQECS